MPDRQTVDVLVIGGGATGAGIVRDLARRGLRSLAVDRSDFGTGTTGRYHGLLHSGGRYVAKDPVAARECIAENRILRRIAPSSVEDTGGYFVATPDDPDDYVDSFPGRCAASGIDCDELPTDRLFAREPALNRGIRRAFRVPDGSLEPWQLIEGNLADARARGSQAWPYQRVVAMSVAGGRIVEATVRDERSGSLTRIAPRFVVSAAGAWAGKVAALAGVELLMTPGKGTMLVYNQRMTDTVINRCHLPGDGDIMVPVHTVAILGTTDIHVPDPDDYEITADEVGFLVNEGAKLFPDLPDRRILRAYGGVRPLYQSPEQAADTGGDRLISRAHAVLDHADQGIDNFVSIVGGKVTTYRLMAQQTVNVVARRLGVSVPCSTADEILPNQGSQHYWLGHRLADHEAEGGGDADLICECEFVTREHLDAFLDARWPCSLDDVRRGTRLGMGPCQGAFCTFRAAGIVADRVAAGAGSGVAAATATVATGGGPDADAPIARAAEASPTRDAALTAHAATLGFLRERFKGDRPIAAGRQLQELFVANGIYLGTLGLRDGADGQG